MSVQVWFSQEEINIQPGTAMSLALAVENVSDRTESYTVIPAGLTAAWSTVTRPNITLFGGSRDVIEVVVRPPAIHSTTAGPTALAVRVIPQGAPDDAVIAETLIGVLPFDDRRITTLQPVQRARRRATYEFMVENHGNNLANCRLHLIDATNRVDGSFNPPAVGVAPGAASLVRLDLKAAGGWLRQSERQLDFEIEATEPDHEPAAGRATLIQSPTVSAHAVGKLLAVGAILLALFGAWVGVIRPELRDAARDAVDDRIAELGATVSDEATVAPATTLPAEETAAPGGPIVVADAGEPVSYRIVVDVGISQTRSESISVPPDSRFHLTDVVPQNPNGDLGSAQLLRNGEILYEWDLGSMISANEFQPRITPIPFDPSDNIVLAVDCEIAGETTGTGCVVSVLLGGVLLPLESDDDPSG